MKRFLTATVMILILVPLLIFSGKVYPLEIIMEVLFIGVAVGASIELLNMYEKKHKIKLKIKITTVLLTILLYASVVNYMYDNYNSFVTIINEPIIHMFFRVIGANMFMSPFMTILFIFVVLMTLFIVVHEFDVETIGRLFVAIIYIGLCVGAFTTLYFFGLRYVLYLLLITVFTDIFALVFGKKFGKHKLAPITSPKKTWEGSIGGTLTALLVGFLFCFFYENISGFVDASGQTFFGRTVAGYDNFPVFGKIVFCIIITVLLSIFSQIGDLVASKLKRHYGIKDYSNIFPGHGGILDRFDSALFASAVFLCFLLIVLNV